MIFINFIILKLVNMICYRTSDTNMMMILRAKTRWKWKIIFYRFEVEFFERIKLENLSNISSWVNKDGISAQGMILRVKINRKYKINSFYQSKRKFYFNRKDKLSNNDYFFTWNWNSL